MLLDMPAWTNSPSIISAIISFVDFSEIKHLRPACIVTMVTRTTFLSSIMWKDTGALFNSY